MDGRRGIVLATLSCPQGLSVERVQALDPNFAIQKNDVYRMARAIAVAEEQGCLYSSFKGKKTIEAPGTWTRFDDLS